MRAVAVIVLLALVNLHHTQPKSYLTFDDEYLYPESIVETGYETTTRGEYEPRWVQMRMAIHGNGLVRPPSGLSVRTLSWTATRHLYFVTAPANAYGHGFDQLLSRLDRVDRRARDRHNASPGVRIAIFYRSRWPARHHCRVAPDSGAPLRDDDFATNSHTADRDSSCLVWRPARAAPHSIGARPTNERLRRH